MSVSADNATNGSKQEAEEFSATDGADFLWSGGGKNKSALGTSEQFSNLTQFCKSADLG